LSNPLFILILILIVIRYDAVGPQPWHAAGNGFSRV